MWRKQRSSALSREGDERWWTRPDAEQSFARSDNSNAFKILWDWRRGQLQR
ncbi:MAG: hypothetical protein H0X49_01665 [Acidobacteria bacterium]|nr:hypothetical protein [Acidobacteriota bacterium]